MARQKGIAWRSVPYKYNEWFYPDTDLFTSNNFITTIKVVGIKELGSVNMKFTKILKISHNKPIDKYYISEFLKQYTKKKAKDIDAYEGSGKWLKILSFEIIGGKRRNPDMPKYRPRKDEQVLIKRATRKRQADLKRERAKIKAKAKQQERRIIRPKINKEVKPKVRSKKKQNRKRSSKK